MRGISTLRSANELPRSEKIVSICDSFLPTTVSMRCVKSEIRAAASLKCEITSLNLLIPCSPPRTSRNDAVTS